jgi:hypothetical protein
VIACGREHIALVAATIWTGLLFLIDLIPSRETFRCVFMLIDPGACEACSRPWEPVFGVPTHRSGKRLDQPLPIALSITGE